ncbi:MULTISPECIES: ABC transporter substrate-binding protein [Streptomyces]|uniref:ABC transporter substrate-binding protein n=1 Tax=Streptomyces doudnae TaxID=3075536 RepID=A0ABD5EJ52_9ACTN|nr:MULTISPECIES: ABC transporter substrate-binding protein [unclassified Streptomyces]MDT0434653.1 ABC transporter substrate-binding protein [Streptomyces sp. DSM 41981]MYQ65188.1 transporter substrate-binding domain-containing protein [Streptomyces sp. SID4950]SCD94638.1 amino acid ABC transporter substrate-binding protein, PAAT family [Streptomyces sp. SolWspMP-5a-2]
MTAFTTRRTTARARTAAVAAIAVAGALILTGCGDQTKDDGAKSSDGASDSSAPLADKLPAEIRSAGVVKVGSDIAYAPVEFKDDSGKVVGLDPDLAAAMGKQLGVKFEFENGTFDALLTGIRSKRYDIAMSAMTDNKNRQDGVDPDTGKKVGEGVDFVDYLTAGVSIYTRKGDTESITTWSDLCGKKLGVERGTVSEDLAKAEAKKCPSGKKLTIEAFDDDQQSQTRLRAGGVDAASSDFPVAAYAVKTSGGGKDFELVGEQVEAAPYGIAVSKENTQLRDAVQAAMDALIKNGEYKKILTKWGAEEGAVTKSVVNGGK